MARPIKSGVSYFPKDTDFYMDDKVRMLRSEYGLFGEKAEAPPASYDIEEMEKKLMYGPIVYTKKNQDTKKEGHELNRVLLAGE